MSNVTLFDHGRAKNKALLSRKSFNGGRNSAKALATLAAAARSVVRETTLKRVTFDVIYATEVDTHDLPRRGKPADEASYYRLCSSIDTPRGQTFRSYFRIYRSECNIEGFPYIGTILIKTTET